MTKGFTLVCLHCGNEFIVEKAIKNFEVNVSGDVAINNSNIVINNGPSVENYLKRGNEYYNDAQFETAVEYYQKVLDLQSDNDEARERIRELTEPVFTSLIGKKMFTLFSFTKIEFWDVGCQSEVVFPLSSVERMIPTPNGIDVYVEGQKYHIDIFDPDRIQLIKLLSNRYFENILENYNTTSLFGFKEYYELYTEGTMQKVYLLRQSIYIITDKYMMYIPLDKIKDIQFKKGLVFKSIIVSTEEGYRSNVNATMPKCKKFTSVELSAGSMGDRFSSLLQKAVKGQFGEPKGLVFASPILLEE